MGGKKEKVWEEGRNDRIRDQECCLKLTLHREGWEEQCVFSHGIEGLVSVYPNQWQ